MYNATLMKYKNEVAEIISSGLFEVSEERINELDGIIRKLEKEDREAKENRVTHSYSDIDLQYMGVDNADYEFGDFN